MQDTNWGQLMDQASATFAPLPVGEYAVTVDTAAAAQTSTGKLMFKIKYKVVGGPHNGRTVFNNVTLAKDNPNALGYFFRDMEAMGLPKQYFAGNPSDEHVAASLVGKSCKVVLEHREYQGEMRENVKSIKKGAAGPAGPGAPPAPPAAAAPVVPAAPPVAVAPVAAPVAAPVPAAALPTASESTVPIPEPANPAPAEAAASATPPPPLPF